MEKFEILCSVTLVLEAADRAEAKAKAIERLQTIGIAPSIIDIDGEDVVD